ncbi:MAG: dTDP-4-dehydrorhamnose reductase, partial [Bacteroidota bacterium]
MKNILVTGSKGQVGQELQTLAPDYPDFKFLFVDVDELDITDGKAVQQFMQKINLDYCINCAAYTAVDKAESDEAMAKKVNVDGVYHLAQACLLHQAEFFQLSTDYVYHNDWNRPLTETAPTDPKSVYARTKLQGDEMAQKILPSSVIIRTSWVYSSFGHNFVKTMRRLGSERDNLNVVIDQIGTPTYARDLAQAMLQMISKVENDEVERSALSGIYHFSNEGVTSWYDFAHA